MDRNDNRHTDRSSLGSTEPDSNRRLDLSVKLRNKLERLARWRIDPSLIGFPGNGLEFRGGNATVSRAVLILPSGSQETVEKPENAADERPISEGQNPESKNGTREPGAKERGVDAFRDNHSDGVETPGANKGERKDNKDDRAIATPQPSKSKDVAVKKLKIEREADVERVLGLALRELEFLLELFHPNIVNIEGYVEDASKGTIWLVFPWEGNGNLRDFITYGEWEIPERISLIRDVAYGVAYLHAQKPPICHGDLKSLNILVNSEHRAIITDFGSARRLGNEESKGQTQEHETKPRSEPDPATGEENTSLQAVFCAATNTITLTGSKYTLRWAAPELLSEDRPTLASDIWALGWIAYEVMTDSIPFHDVKKDTIVIKRVIQGDLPSITEHARMSLIRELCSLMAECWKDKPSQRPTAEDCIRSLDWMPGIIPASTQTIDPEVSKYRNAQLLLKIGEMYVRQGDYDNALNYCNKSLHAYQHARESTGRAEVLSALANVHVHRREITEATKLYSEALHIYTSLGAPTAEPKARTLWFLADIHRAEGEMDRAFDLYSESLQILTDLGFSQGIASALWGLAEVHRSRRQYSEATALYSKALEIHTEVGDRQSRAQNLWSLAEVCRLQREYEKAIRFYSESLQISTDLGDRYNIAWTLLGIAEVHRLQSDFSKAIRSYTEALQIRSDIGDRRGRAIILWYLAETHYKQDHSTDAKHFYTEASKSFGEVGDSVRAAKALEKAAEIRNKLTSPHDRLVNGLDNEQGQISMS